MCEDCLNPPCRHYPNCLFCLLWIVPCHHQTILLSLWCGGAWCTPRIGYQARVQIVFCHYTHFVAPHMQMLCVFQISALDKIIVGISTTSDGTLQNVASARSVFFDRSTF